jgi:hypothetical protein
MQADVILACSAMPDADGARLPPFSRYRQTFRGRQLCGMRMTLLIFIAEAHALDGLHIERLAMTPWLTAESARLGDGWGSRSLGLAASGASSRRDCAAGT